MNFLSNLKNLLSKPQPVIEPVKPELKKRTKKLLSKKEMVDLGVTYVLLKFSDGRDLITKVYGTVSSSSDRGSDEGLRQDYSGRIVYSVLEEPTATHQVTTSLSEAQAYIKKIGKGKRDLITDTFLPADNTYTDCPRVPTISQVGKVITATILRTESHLEEVTKYSVEPV